MGLELLKPLRRLIYLAAIAIFAVVELAHAGLARRTFVFYSFERGKVTVEDRMLHRASTPELDIRDYVEEALLGPVSLDLAPLFTKGTKLRSLLYRDRVVYADLSGDAIFPVAGGESLLKGLIVLRQGIVRNFPPVVEVKFFIEGNEAYPVEFGELFQSVLPGG